MSSCCVAHGCKSSESIALTLNCSYSCRSSLDLGSAVHCVTRCQKKRIGNYSKHFQTWWKMPDISWRISSLCAMDRWSSSSSLHLFGEAWQPLKSQHLPQWWRETSPDHPLRFAISHSPRKNSTGNPPMEKLFFSHSRLGKTSALAAHEPKYWALL